MKTPSSSFVLASAAAGALIVLSGASGAGAHAAVAPHSLPEVGAASSTDEALAAIALASRRTILDSTYHLAGTHTRESITYSSVAEPRIGTTVTRIAQGRNRSDIITTTSTPAGPQNVERTTRYGFHDYRDDESLWLPWKEVKQQLLPYGKAERKALLSRLPQPIRTVIGLPVTSPYSSKSATALATELQSLTDLAISRAQSVDVSVTDEGTTYQVTLDTSEPGDRLTFIVNSDGYVSYAEKFSVATRDRYFNSVRATLELLDVEPDRDLTADAVAYPRMLRIAGKLMSAEVRKKIAKLPARQYLAASGGLNDDALHQEVVRIIRDSWRPWSHLCTDSPVGDTYHDSQKVIATMSCDDKYGSSTSWWHITVTAGEHDTLKVRAEER